MHLHPSFVHSYQLDDTGKEERTDTDKNMATMFEILRRKKRVRLESLFLNRKSFAQTVENLFAMSFLVKDGRAEIVVDENGSHLVCKTHSFQTSVALVSPMLLFLYIVIGFLFFSTKECSFCKFSNVERGYLWPFCVQI